LAIDIDLFDNSLKLQQEKLRYFLLLVILGNIGNGVVLIDSFQNMIKSVEAIKFSIHFIYNNFVKQLIIYNKINTKSIELIIILLL